MDRYSFYRDRNPKCDCNVVAEGDGLYVEYNEKRDHAYKLLLAYAEYFSLPFTKQQELLTRLNFDSAEQLRANALEAAREAG